MEQHWGQIASQTVRELQDPRASYCSQVCSLASFTQALRWGSVLCFGKVGGFCLFLMLWVEKNIIIEGYVTVELGYSPLDERNTAFLGGSGVLPVPPAAALAVVLCTLLGRQEGAWAFRIGWVYKEILYHAKYTTVFLSGTWHPISLPPPITCILSSWEEAQAVFFSFKAASLPTYLTTILYKCVKKGMKFQFV